MCRSFNSVSQWARAVGWIASTGLFVWLSSQAFRFFSHQTQRERDNLIENNNSIILQHAIVYMMPCLFFFEQNKSIGKYPNANLILGIVWQIVECFFIWFGSLCRFFADVWVRNGFLFFGVFFPGRFYFIFKLSLQKIKRESFFFFLHREFLQATMMSKVNVFSVYRGGIIIVSCISQLTSSKCCCGSSGFFNLHLQI